MSEDDTTTDLATTADPHFTAATNLLANLGTCTENSAMLGIAAAQVHAILALCTAIRSQAAS